MSHRKISLPAFVLALFFAWVGSALAQAPIITYPSPPNYTTNTPIAPLSPKNTGGAVPKTTYGLVSTIAGGKGTGAVNGIGTAATFNHPAGVALDGDGNLYVADEYNHLIRKIDATGLVSTFAGSGVQGNTDGTGTAASFNDPIGLVTDINNNIYVTDFSNNLVRKITPTGVVTTIAGNGSNMLIDGSGTASGFSGPIGLAIDNAGNIYVTNSNSVRKITPAGIVSTVAGSSKASATDGSAATATFNDPYGITVDLNGNILVCDLNNNLIRKITPGGTVSTFAGSGPPGDADGVGRSASFRSPYDIATDAQNNFYVADAFNFQIRKITQAGVVTTIAGTGSPGSADGIGTVASFNVPTSIAIDQSGNLYVNDIFSNTIRFISLTGYSIDKPLPPGLIFDPTTGIISGTPTAVSPATDYRITAYNAGGNSSTTVNITVVDIPVVTFAPFPPKSACDADFDPDASTPSGPVTYTSDNASVATITNGEIHITGAGTATITASNGVSSAKQTLTVSAAITPTITISPDAIGGCQGFEATFTATAINGGNNPAYQWQVNGQNAGTNSNTFISSMLNSNDKVTCILTSNADCITSATATSNVGTVILDAPVTTSVSISSSETSPVCKGTPITFTAVTNTPDNNPVYQWRVNNNIRGNNSPTFTSSDLSDGDVVTCYLSSGGECLVNPVVLSNSITVALNPVDACTISIPNAFTPNGDGINDLWNIKSLLYYPDCRVRVFSRLGQQVFQSRGYTKAWDGTINNSPLPTGTYYYVIDLNNGTSPLAGFVAILR